MGDHDDTELVACPHCSGFGTVNCHCGGDQCYCDNHGDAPCPVCDEEGEVSAERWDRYMEAQRRHMAEMQRVWEKMEVQDG